MQLFDLTLPDGRNLALAEWGDPQGKLVFVFVGGQGRATCHPDEMIAQRVGLRLLWEAILAQLGALVLS